MTSSDDLRVQLDSLHSISVEIAALNEMSDVHDRALTYCLELTLSEFAFTGLLIDGPRVMDVVAIKGFEPVDPEFYENFRVIAVGSSVVAVTIEEERSYISNDVLHDPHRAGLPPGHPDVRTQLSIRLALPTRPSGVSGGRVHAFAINNARCSGP